MKNKFDFSKVVKYLKVLGVVLFIIFEEIVWNKIGKSAYLAVKSLKIMDRFKVWVSEFDNRFALLAIFLAPFIGMEILSLFAVKALATGAIVTGVGLYVFKALLTAPVVIIFNTAKPQLTSFLPIRYGYGCILNLKRSNTFRSVKVYIGKVKVELAKFKDEYLNGDAKLSEELKKMYEDIKKV
jgi:hypothetical protein